MWKNGGKKPLSPLIGPPLVRNGRGKARTLEACGVDDAKLAEEAGIVKIYYERPEERMSLDPTI
jgi:hypothetical protein